MYYKSKRSLYFIYSDIAEQGRGAALMRYSLVRTFSLVRTKPLATNYEEVRYFTLVRILSSDKEPH